MKKLRKLPIFLALLLTFFASACSEIEVDPRGGGDEDDDPVIIPPPPTKSSTSSDTLTIG